MEAKINVAEILKDKPQGTKLYSSACGKCELKQVDDNSFKISFYSSKFGFMNGGEGTFDKNGNLYDDGECIVFPSKEMRDWSKFSWKKGNILISNDGKVKVIFEKFRSDTYQSFIGKHHLDSIDETPHYQDEGEYPTFNFSLESEDSAYINTIEERLGGKLNSETLEVEKAQPEFNDGDFVVTDAVPSMCYSKCIFILKGDLDTGENCANSYVFYNINNNYINFNVLDTMIRDRNIHLATEEEKQKLFSALAKEGKVWIPEKKQIVDLKPKWTPKPFERVITRNAADDVWTANIFSHMDSHGEYVTIACVGGYTYCIPYNEDTAKLIGTTDNVEV